MFYLNGHPVRSGVGLGEEAAAFGLVGFYFGVAGRIMADEEFRGAGLLRQAGGLEGGGMVTLGALVCQSV